VQIRSIAHFRQTSQQNFPAIDSRAEKRGGRGAKKKGFLRDLRASARVQAFQVLVTACLSVRSFAQNSAFSEKLALLRFLCVLLFKLFGRGLPLGASVSLWLKTEHQRTRKTNQFPRELSREISNAFCRFLSRISFHRFLV
jgi:hypothetical protein